MKTLAIATVALVAITSSAFAQSGRIDRREARQENQIEAGVRSGDLTRREARLLEAEQARIHALERSAKRDGHVDRREAAQIESAQDAARRHIAQERNDGDRRGQWAQRRWW